MEATVRQRTLRAVTLIGIGLVGILLISGDPLRALRTPAFIAAAGSATVWTVVENLTLRQDEPASYRGKLSTRLVQAGVMVTLFASAVDYFWFDPVVPRTSAVAAAGAAVTLAGAAIRIWAIRTLAHHFRYELRVEEGQRLVTGGPYRLVRHPSYLGIILVAVGCAVAMASLVGVAVGVVVLGTVLVLRIREEESVLVQSFGPEYDAYRSRSWRLLPPIY